MLRISDMYITHSYYRQLKVSIDLTAIQLDSEAVVAEVSVNLVLRGFSFSKGVRGDRDP